MSGKSWIVDELQIMDWQNLYVQAEIKKMNEKYQVERVEYNFKADFNEHVEHTNDEASSSNDSNIGYFYL